MLMLLLPLLASAAGDCALQADPYTRLVCADPRLAATEKEVAHLYRSALTQLPSGARAAEQHRQQEWLAARAGCLQDPQAHDCVAELLGERRTELRIRLGQQPVFASVSYLCPGEPPTTLQASYYRSDPAAVRLRYAGGEVLAFQAPSGSGARYTAQGVELWEHQGVARFTWHGSELSCPKK